MEAALWRGEGDLEEATTPAVSSRGGLVALVNTSGPPWFDEYTGEELPLDQVERGMKELASFEHFGVTQWVPEKDVEGELVSSRWLLKRRDATTLKARIVAQQLNRGAAMDTFAATPTTTAHRLMLYIAHIKKLNVALGDMGTAFLHAPLPKDMIVHVQPPMNLRRPGEVWKLFKALYGLRQAPRLFQEFLAASLLKLG